MATGREIESIWRIQTEEEIEFWRIQTEKEIENEELIRKPAL